MSDIKVFHSSLDARNRFAKNHTQLIGLNDFTTVNNFPAQYRELKRIVYFPGGMEKIEERIAIGYQDPKLSTNPRLFRPEYFADLKRSLYPARPHGDLLFNLDTIAGWPKAEKIEGLRPHQVKKQLPLTIYENHFRLSYFIHRATELNPNAGLLLAYGHDLLVETDFDEIEQIGKQNRIHKPIGVLSDTPALKLAGAEDTHKLFYWLGDELQTVVPNTVKQLKGFALEAIKRSKGGLIHHVQAGSYWDLLKALLR